MNGRTFANKTAGSSLMTTNLIDLTGFATLLNDIVASAETPEERTHLELVIERIKDGEPTSQPLEAAIL